MCERSLTEAADAKRTDADSTAIPRDGFVMDFGASFHVFMELLD